MVAPALSRRAVWKPLWRLPWQSELILPLARRELLSRYRGSSLGLLWAVLNPLALIAIFTFIFSSLFHARFGQGDQSHWDYALYLFCGLVPWIAFQEPVQAATGVIVAHANLVKRVVFPLEVLPVAGVLAALVNQGIGTVVLLAAALLIRGEIHVTLFWAPIIVVPQILATLGFCWLVSSMGVFLRDTTHAAGLALMVWMYLTPVIYPESVVPPKYRLFIEANPFTALVRNYRRVLLDGVAPDWGGLGYFSLFALVAFLFGYWWFAKTRRNFADVI